MHHIGEFLAGLEGLVLDLAQLVVALGTGACGCGVLGLAEAHGEHSESGQQEGG